MNDLKIKNQDFGKDCYYETTVTRLPHAPLQTSVTADVVIVGGGLAGLSTALELADLGQEVVLIEAERLCGHASGRNGGQAISGYACGQLWLEKQLGPKDAQLLWHLSLASIARMRERIDRYSIDCNPVWQYITVADRARKAQALRSEEQHMRRHYGHEMTYVHGTSLLDQVGSPRYVAGLIDPASGHLNPLRYGLGIAMAASNAGVRLYEHSAALSMQREGPLWRVRTQQGDVLARQVVLAGNCGLLWHSPQLATRLHSRIMPVGTHIIATEPLSAELANSLLPTQAAVCDNNFVLDYFRLSADRRMLFGGRVSYSTRLPAHLAQSMRQRMVQVFPQLAKVQIDHTWSGFVDISLKRAPDWGRLDEGVYFAQGFSGHGLAATTLAGRVIAQALAGDTHALSVFERIRQSPFPGGPIWRIPLLLAGTSYYRVLDWLS